MSMSSISTSTFRPSTATFLPKSFIYSQSIPHRLSFPQSQSQPQNLTLTPNPRRFPPLSATNTNNNSTPTSFTGPCFVVGDNIDTDQIIPAEYLTLVPSNPDEYKKLGSFAFIGLPSSSYPTRFVENNQFSTPYPIVIAGANFGCGSSREHAPVALGAAGAVAVVAESYARIFFRNSVATGEIYPLECEGSGIWRECRTGDVVTVDMEACVLVNRSTGKEYRLKSIGDAGPVIQAGGIFAYARETGMIAAAGAVV